MFKQFRFSSKKAQQKFGEGNGLFLLILVALILLPIGIQIYQTLNPEVQRFSNRAVNRHIQLFKEHFDSVSNFDNPTVVHDYKQLHLVACTMEVFGQSNIQSSRELCIAATQDCLEKFDQDKYRKYLKDGALTEKDIHYQIFFLDANGKCNEMGIALCSVTKNGNILYLVHRDGGFMIRYEEPYQEALNIVKNRAPDLLEKKVRMQTLKDRWNNRDIF